MTSAQDPERIIATLQQAKMKLTTAQRQTFEGLTRLNKIRDAIQVALGRLGQGNPAIALLRKSEKSIKDRAVEINGLAARIDTAIAEIRQAALGGGAGARGGPAPGPV